MLMKVKTSTYGMMILKSSMVIIKAILKRKISEVLYVSKLKPTLNIKDKSIRLELYN